MADEPHRNPSHANDSPRVLRSPPSAEALTWAAVAAGADIVSWEVLRGGTSSGMYRLSLSNGTELVLRCYVLRHMIDEEPDLPTREAAALRVVHSSAIPTPELVAIDAGGSVAGVPSLLMTRLPGRVEWDPQRSSVWLERLASVLPVIHDADPSVEGVGSYSNYAQRSYDPPPWATDPAVWDRAIELFHGPILDTRRCFVHRDFHPGNVLWRRSDLTGVVDWQAACIGPPSIDIAHCRANFLLYRPELADEFTDIAQRHLGQPFVRWADIAALNFGPEHRAELGMRRARFAGARLEGSYYQLVRLPRSVCSCMRCMAFAHRTDCWSLRMALRSGWSSRRHSSGAYTTQLRRCVLYCAQMQSLARAGSPQSAGHAASVRRAGSKCPDLNPLRRPSRWGRADLGSLA